MWRKPSDRRHAAVAVQVGERREEIDEAIAPLIEALWRAGIPTLMSCQETKPGTAWIEFEDLKHLRQFLNLVAQYEEGDDSLYDRISHELIIPQRPHRCGSIS